MFYIKVIIANQNEKYLFKYNLFKMYWKEKNNNTEIQLNYHSMVVETMTIKKVKFQNKT